VLSQVSGTAVPCPGAGAPAAGGVRGDGIAQAAKSNCRWGGGVRGRWRAGRPETRSRWIVVVVEHGDGASERAQTWPLCW
jgi:hypothetical protein